MNTKDVEDDGTLPASVEMLILFYIFSRRLFKQIRIQMIDDKIETLQEAYWMAKKNNGAPGIDGVTFKAIEERGVESFPQQIRDEFFSNTYRPQAL